MALSLACPEIVEGLSLNGIKTSRCRIN